MIPPPFPNLLKVFGLSFSAVAVMFIGYDIVERVWLKGVDPSVLFTLHILRGLSGAAIGALLATIIVFREIRGSRGNSAPKAGFDNLRRRLQKVSLRTKITVPMVGLAVLPTLVVGVFAISKMQKSLRANMIERLEYETKNKAQIIEDYLHSVQDDVIFLSRSKAVRDLAFLETETSKNQLHHLRLEVEKEFHDFSRGKRAYYQVRFLNSAGYEVVRLNLEREKIGLVPSGQLQDKSDRYYVKAALAMEPGKVYASKVDLNMEHGKLEIPKRAVIRYGTQVVNDKQKNPGLVIINIFTEQLLGLFPPFPEKTEAWLTNNNDFYFDYAGISGSLSPRYGLEHQRKITADFSTDVVSEIFDKRTSKVFDDKIFSGARISVDREDSNRNWRLLVSYSREPIDAPVRAISIYLSVVLFLITAISGLLGILLGDYLSRPVARLQEATRGLASGDLNKKVDIATGDEIEGLARDFNKMTRRVREGQEQLSGVNRDLEKEVARQTEKLAHLQVGMARADKLASIGQVTAGVMHEVGNPLAAIKTKIQLAQRNPNLGTPENREVLSEILNEVDRLVMFLHSFSRLSKLSDHQEFSSIALTEIIYSVTSLLSADLRKKGIFLGSEIQPKVPGILGKPIQLRQLLMNLIINAADASKGGEKVTVTLESVADSEGPGFPGSVLLKVLDSGSGIDPALIPKIWDPFFTTKKQGTGLGLAICRQIVRDHEGSIKIESDGETGTIIAVRFPAHKLPT